MNRRTFSTASQAAARNGNHPHPHIRSAATNSGLAAASAALPRSRNEPLQPGEFVAFGPRVGIPHDDRQVMPSERIAERVGCRVDVDRALSGQNLPNPQRANTVLVLQPSLAFAFVHDDHLLRNPVDVLEQHRADRLDDGKTYRWLDIERAYFAEHDLVQPALAETISTDERVDRDAALRQPSRVFECRSWCLDTFHRDVVPQRVHDGVHVSLDAGAEQLDQARVSSQLGDVVFEGAADLRGHLGESIVEPGCGLGDVAAHIDFVVDARIVHPTTVDPAVTAWCAIACADFVFG